MTVQELMAKAEQAASSAKVLLDIGDLNGAANRAYYAMFDAARAALLVTGVAVEPDGIRTHSGLIGAFGQHLVKHGPVSKDVGRLLNRAHEIRLVADYKGHSVEPGDAREIVEQAERFVATMKATMMPEASSKGPKGHGHGMEP